jgi:hypothetical protein
MPMVRTKSGALASVIGKCCKTLTGAFTIVWRCEQVKLIEESRRLRTKEEVETMLMEDPTDWHPQAAEKSA